jgi:hypothetical protein
MSSLSIGAAAGEIGRWRKMSVSVVIALSQLDGAPCGTCSQGEPRSQGGFLWKAKPRTIKPP